MCTEKALKTVKAGQEREARFAGAVLEGIREEDRAVMERCFKLMDENIDKIIKAKLSQFAIANCKNEKEINL